MRTVILAAATLFTSGCLLFFDDGGKRPPQCDLATSGAESQPAPLRDPESLTCNSFGGDTCDPACGPCPLSDVAALSPIPSWPMCGSACESLNESACAASAECRVVKDARCVIGEDCVTDFVGCFPIDNVQDPTVDCFAARDGWTCSRSAACTALHDRRSPCPANDDTCSRPFGLCVPEGKSPGVCHEQATCDVPSPNCRAGTTPGVANGCYTGACIQFSLCEPSA